MSTTGVTVKRPTLSASLISSKDWNCLYMELSIFFFSL